MEVTRFSRVGEIFFGSKRRLFLTLRDTSFVRASRSLTFFFDHDRCLRVGLGSLIHR